MKNIYVPLIGIALLFSANGVKAQAIPANRITDWSKAGLQGPVPAYANVINIMNYGGIDNGSASNHTAFQAAVAALGGGPGVIDFPAGTYLFTQPISLRDSLVIRGAGNATKLLFDLGGAFQNAIIIEGSISTTTWDVVQTANKNDSILVLMNKTGLGVGDWMMVTDDDTSKVTSPWAYGVTGQIFRIENIIGDTLVADNILRRNYPVDSMPFVRKITPVKGAGIECLYIERQDSTATQTYNVYTNYVVNSWVIGVESNSTNFAHIGLNASSHMLIRGNYIHHSHGYGGGGRGYGVVLQYTTGDCLVDNNLFEFLRHSMLLQLGANGNVLSYNYSKDPNWNEPPLPANSAGDAVLHGDYPYLNLFEGNVVQHIVIDNSHGKNGPYNTFFRNRAQLYGIFMNSGTGVTDSVNFVGNEVTNTGPAMGNFSLAGVGHLQQANTIKGILTPAGSTAAEQSLYLTSPPPFWQGQLQWPTIGTPFPYNQYPNTAQARYSTQKTDCRINPVYVGIDDVGGVRQFKVFPNPASGQITFALDAQKDAVIEVSDVLGRSVAQLNLPAAHNKVEWNTAGVKPGIYLYRVSIEGIAVQTGRLAITE
ncbi:T9SS type A sorting domain-containing protein [Polluticoccus soli]|uniref:T9SS type A sorting domain-containing protein n=1 Tax=Polluticoccus soli TaxID=3034150 RepID=UPI0023E1AE0E|nr:T9SS type A sorting domain-containing protein [Flavipsychrobacter sp. JY13-12]